MAQGIATYHIADFGSVKAATTAAAALLEYLTKGLGLRHMTGPRRAVVWGEGAAAPALDQARLYLSDGALEAVRELGLAFTLRESLAADQLSGTAKILVGDP